MNSPIGEDLDNFDNNMDDDCSGYTSKYYISVHLEYNLLKVQNEKGS
jgi:hypothetical protein